jgi:multidrug efflux pump
MATERQSFFEICIHRPVMTSMMSLMLVIFGIIGLTELPVRELPDVDPSVVTVVTIYPGASAEVVETEVTEPLEDAISSVESIRLLTSETFEQSSVITVEFLLNRDVDLAAQDVRDRVASARGRLPDTINEPIVQKQLGSGAGAIIWLSMYSDSYAPVEMNRIAEDVIKDRLQTVPGVSSILLAGEKRFAMRIRLDSERMAARGITVGDVETALREQNVELPSGRVENMQRELTIQMRGQLDNVEEFNRLIIRQDGSDVVRLLDIGFAEEGVEDERSIARVNGRTTVSLGIVRQSQANSIEIAAGVKKVIEDLQRVLPEEIKIVNAYDTTVFVKKAVNEVFQSLAIAGVLVVLTIFIFLRNIRATLIPALSIPVSVLATFGVLYWMGFSINLFTLLALVLAIGIVVDDAIVVLENTHRHIENGMAPFDAAIKTMQEIAFAIVTITLSLIAVFTPLAFLTGIVGKLLIEFAAALVVAVIVSAFVALTLSPMISARVLKPASEVEHGRLFNAFERFFDRLNGGYERLLTWSLGHRVWVVGVVLGSLLLSWYLFVMLDSEFLPEEDKGQFVVMAMSPEGATPEYTDRMVREVERLLGDIPEVRSVFSATALPFGGAGDPTRGFAFVELKEGPRRHLRDIIDGPDGLSSRLFMEVEGALAFAIKPKAINIGFGQPFSLVVINPDLVELDAYARELVGRLQQEGYLANIRSEVELTKPDLRISVDRDRAGALGISIEDISRTLQVLFGGEDLSEIKIDGKEYEVIVQLDRMKRLTPTDLERLFVRNSRGELIQLSSVVNFDTGAGPNRIQRFQRLRSTTIQATPVGITLGTAVARTIEILDETMPPGFSYDWSGEARDLNESSNDFLFFTLLAILVVYMVLAAQFESLVHPLTVMLALPMAFLGAFGSLYLLNWVDYGAMVLGTDYLPRIPSMNLNIFSQVGLVILIGLVTKNSILLVEFANQRMADGMTAKQAMLQAGLIRFRPILMTSLATIAGILPIAIGFGDASESRRPLGVVAVGGLVTSTMLTLFVIPVFYTIFDDLGARFRRTGQQPADQPA